MGLAATTVAPLAAAAGASVARPQANLPIGMAGYTFAKFDLEEAIAMMKRVNITNSGQPNYLMPKLLVGGTRMLHGVTKTREILFKALEQEFKIASP